MIGWKDIIAGLLTFFAAHAIEAAAWPWFDPAGTSTPWFLNAGRAAAFTAAALLLAGTIAGAFGAASGESAIARGGNIAAGAIAAMTVVLFAKGPGTLFPIALAFGAVIVATSSVAGAIAGRSLETARRVRRM